MNCLFFLLKNTLAKTIASVFFILQISAPSDSQTVLSEKDKIEYLLKKYENYSNEELHNELKNMDLETANKVHPNNRRRVVRALNLIEKNNIEEEFKTRKINSENKIKQLEESIENLKKENQDKQVDIDVEIKKIEEEGQKLTEEIDSIRLVKLIKFDEESLTKARNDLAELKTKSSIAWKNAKTLESGVCPVCGSTNCG